MNDQPWPQQDQQEDVDEEQQAMANEFLDVLCAGDVPLHQLSLGGRYWQQLINSITSNLKGVT
jgi:hypothetical protein